MPTPQTLYRYGTTEVSRCSRGAQSVIVKSVSRVDEGVCASLQREYAILRQLACAEIPQALELSTEADTLDLVLEDIGATSLDRLAQRWDVDTVLLVTEQVCQALIGTHRARLVHRDINPRNIVYNASTARAQLIDFGLAGQEVTEVGGRQAGTLAYFSPEQTGRTRHPVDHRTDLYALGVVIYQLLAGKLPFESADSTALFQQILSAPVPPLTQQVPGTPALLSALVQRLMCRDPAERYQSAAGLRHDVLQLRRALQEGAAPAFALGENDRREALVLPERLYGSDDHVAQLRAFYTHAVQGKPPRIALLRGEAGVGKSSIVNRLHETVHGEHGVLLSGKHDANHRNIPFDSVRQLLAQLTRQVLALPEAEVTVWRRRLHNSLGRSAGALVEVAPELRLLLGEVEPVAVMEPQQTENRLLSLLRRLVEALGRGAPTLLFLDDLQWADSGTLKFVTMLSDPALAEVPVVLVGAYRSNEVDAAHPLTRCLTDLQERGLAPLQIAVEPLGPAHLQALLHDLFAGSDPAAVAQLAAFVEQRTQNNPFYVRELLAHCWRTRLIDFDPQRGGFVWDAEQLAHASVPDSAVGLVMSQIDTLSAESAELMELAACLGTVVAEEVLQQVSSVPLERPLRALLQTGLLVPTEVPRVLRFAHDRIRQAAYERLPAATLQSNHRRLAQALQPLQAAGKVSIFELLEQVNAALATYQEAAERLQVAAWNAVGAHKARQSLAYATAQQCLEVTLRMLPEDLATRDPAQYDDLHSELAINLFMQGHTDQALAQLAALLPLSAEPMRVASIEALRILMLGSSGRGREALQARDRGLQALGYAKKLGSKGVAPLNLLRLGWQMRAVNAETFQHRPRCTNPRAILAQRILSLSGVWAHEVSVPEVLANSAWAAMLTWREGWTTYSAHAVSGFCLLLALLNRPKAAARLGAAARSLYAMADTVDWFAVEIILLNWSDGLKLRPVDMVIGSQRCYEGARQAGDPVWSGLAVGSILGYDLYVSIDRTLEVCERTISLIKSLRNPMQMGMFFAWQGLCLCLAGRTDGVGTLASAALDRDTLEAYLSGKHGVSALISMSISQVMSFVVNGAYAEARAAVPRLLKTEFWRNAALPSVASGLFYAALALIKSSPADLPLARQLCKRIAKLAAGSEACLGHGDVLILEGLFAAEAGKSTKALQHMNEALEWSRRMGFLDRECLALEYTGRMHAAWGNPVLAAVFLRQAHTAYTTWGARARATHLASELNLQSTPALATNNTNSVSRSTSNHTSSVHQESDLAGMLQGIQFLSRELPVQQLGEQLVSALQRSTGATRVALLQSGTQSWEICADTAPAGTALLHTAVRLAANTRRVLLPADLQQLGEPLPKSILCAPLVFGEQVVGVLYLENEHVDGAFPRHRQKSLEIWASQASAALAHAALRENMQKAVQRQTDMLRQAHQQVLTQQREQTEERMAGGFAHEMRNALAGAGFALQSVYDPNNPDAVFSRLWALGSATDAPESSEANALALRLEVTAGQELLQAVMVGVDRANRITSEILAYSQASQALASDAPTHLSAVVQAVLDEQAQRLRTHNIETDIQVDSSLTVSAQESHTAAILRNLVRNAVDALAHESLTERRLSVQVAERAGALEVRVSDTAAGMEPAVQARLFEPFFTTKGTAGIGLGLGLSRKLARLHGGDLRLASTQGQGSTFALVLPTPRKT